MEILFPLLKKYIKIPIYGTQTKQLLQQLWYIHTLIQSIVTLNVPAITQASILQISDDYIRSGQRNY